MADYICSNTFMDYADKQDVLECLDLGERLRMLLMLLSKENTTLEIETELHERVQAEIDKNQREYYLREEMRVISESLGEEDNPQEEADGYREKIGKLRCDEEAKTHLLKECDKLAKMPQRLLRGHSGAQLFGQVPGNSVRYIYQRQYAPGSCPQGAG